MEMRIKIIKNAPNENGCKSIEHLIGQEFEVIDEEDLDRGIAYINLENRTIGSRYAIFKGEYEVVQLIGSVRSIEIKLTQGKTLREGLTVDFGVSKERVDSMTDDEVNEEILFFIGETEQ